MEAAVAGKPLICTGSGGTAELLDPSLVPALTCASDRHSLAERLLTAVQEGLPQARLAVAPAVTLRRWIELHQFWLSKARPVLPKCPKRRHRPKIAVVITHFQRPAKLFDAVMSIAAQTYANMEIVVVDDGSGDPLTWQALDCMKPLFAKLNVRLLRQSNQYLGAARNAGVEATQSDYILFLDDDDVALPNLAHSLATVAESTRADIVNCIQLYMPETRRSEAYPFPEQFSEKASYIPIGGPLSVAPYDNCYGGSTVLIRRTALKRIGGYTEDYGIGHEDFELYVRALQAGLSIEICPLPLVLYETGRPSMLTTTSRLRNWNRIARAIDVSQQPAIWNDLVSTVAGIRAEEHNRNYGQWWKASSPHSSLLQRISTEPVDSVEYPALVREYAVAIWCHIVRERFRSFGCDAGTGCVRRAHCNAATRAACPGIGRAKRIGSADVGSAAGFVDGTD